MSRRANRIAVKRMLEEHAGEILEAEIAVELAPRPGALVLTPELWQDSCRNVPPYCTSRTIRERGGSGPCALCDQARAIDADAFSRPWTEGRPRADAGPLPTRWRSVDAALEAWALPAGGRGLRSSTGPMLERARDALGLATGSMPDDGVMIGPVLVLAVERAVARAYEPAVRREGLTVARCEGLLRARALGTDLDELAAALGLEPRVVRAVAAHGRRIVRVELAALGLIPPPKRHDPQRLEIAQRREELARTG